MYRGGTKIVERGDAQHRGERRGPPAETQPGDGHAEQVDHHQVDGIQVREHDEGDQRDSAVSATAQP